MADIEEGAKVAPNPGSLGLVAFGLTTIMLSSVNAGLLPAGGEGVIVPLALAFGGTVQVVAGVLEFGLGNTFGVTAFLSYGAFWWWFALLQIFAKTGIIDISQAGPTVGVCLLLWGVFTLYMWISTFRLSRMLRIVFGLLWVTFFLLAFGSIAQIAVLTHAGGWIGIVCGLAALFGSFGIVTNATFGRTIVPL